MRSSNPLSIIIVTCNSQDTIEGCLKSIQKQEIRPSILIIDNNSKDRTLEKLEKFKNISLIKNSGNQGFAKAVNQGIKHVQKKFSSSYVLLLNPDTTLEKNCLKKLIKEIKTDNKIGLCSPIIKDPKTEKIIFQKGVIDWTRMRTVHSNSKNAKTDYLTGACLLIKNAVSEKIGFLDESFFLYYEDVDFSLRAQRAGFKIKTALEAVCYHNESHSSDSETKTYFLVKNGLIFFNKHLPLPLKIFYFWPIFWLRFFYHLLISRKKPVIKGMRDFLFIIN